MASKSPRKCILEKRPKLLKDFLHENINTTQMPNYSGLNSNPDSDNKSDVVAAAAPAPATLQRSRSRSRAAAEAAITSFHKLINAVKNLQYYSSSSSVSSSNSHPLTLQRSFSKKLLGRLSIKKKKKGGDNNNKKSNEREGILPKVKVKDILKWRSFRDLDEQPPRSGDYPHCEFDDVVILDDEKSVNTSETTTTSCSRGSHESGSSWGETEYDFTADKLPCLSGNSGEMCDKWDNDDDVVVRVSHLGPKEDNQSMGIEEDKEQHSPVSVLDSPFREELSDEDFTSSFDKSLANMERTKQSLLQRIQWFESLAGVVELDDESMDEEEEEQESETSKEDENAIEVKKRVYLSRAMSKLMKGGQCLKYREDCIKDMQKQEQWCKFEDEQKDVGFEIEVQLLSDLVNEVLVDLC